MSLRINTNLSSLNVLRNVGENETMLSGVIERLSTGLRINHGYDDPAGLIISENMRAQMRGTEQAVRNTQDALNMAKTAESSLDEVQRLLRDMRALAVQSANTAVSDSNQLQANQTQIRSAIQSINRIATQTQFGQKKLLDGTAGVQANVTDPANVAGLFVGGSFGSSSVSSGPVTIQRTTSATRATNTLGRTFASSSTVVATAGSFVINGYSFYSSGTDTLATLVGKINEMSPTTGVTAQITGAGPVQVQLLARDYGSQFNINYIDSSTILHTSTTASSVGIDAVFNVTMTTSTGAQTVTFTGGRGPRESGLRLSDTFGNVVQLTEAGNLAFAAAGQAGTVTAGSVFFQIGPYSNQSISYSMPVVFADRLGTNVIAGQSVSTLDVTSQAGAQNAMRIVDDAISQVGRIRGDLGAFMANILQSNVRSLGVAQENLTASESQIRDADMAKEISDMTRFQLLRQSGISVLAQANQLPQGVLSLLRGG